MAVDAESLRLAAADSREAATRAEELVAFRDDLVRKAMGEGWTYAQIAAATSLSTGRIGQIAQRAKA